MFVDALIIGAVLALLELGILVAARQKLGPWIYVQSLAFWFTCGAMIAFVDLGIQPVVGGVLVSVFLNLPWYINISIIPREYRHLGPLIVASAVLGAVGGGIKMVL